MIRKQSYIISVIFLFFFAIIATAKTEKRVALVWGNASYHGWQNLPKCINDAEVVGKKLYELGFDTIMLEDGNYEEMRISLKRFENKIKDADVAVFFYSGHAFYKKDYYLVPSKTKLDENDRLRLDYFPAKDILDMMYNRSQLSLLFFDACRESGGLRGATKGLSVSQNIGTNRNANKAYGYAIYYATENDEKATTGEDELLSPFSQALVDHLSDTDEFSFVWPKIRDEVEVITENRQTPDADKHYTNSFYFNSNNHNESVQDDNIQTARINDALRYALEDSPYVDFIDKIKFDSDAEECMIYIVGELEWTKTELEWISNRRKQEQQKQNSDSITPPKPRYVHQVPKVKIIGLDMSKHQGQIDWNLLNNHHHNVGYVYLKATEGSNYVDPLYRQNLLNARKNGIRVGSYHFMTDRSPVTTQFQNFVKNVQIDEQDLIPVIDCERLGNWTPEQLRDSLKLFANLIEKHYGKKPIIYTGESFFRRNLGPDFYNYSIWIAKYSPTPPYTPPEIGCEWTIWQYSESGLVSGINNPTDISIFNKQKSVKDILLKPK